MPRRLAALVSVLVLASAIGGGPTVAASGPTADLDGATIPIARASSYYCHDLDFPRIHCFSRADDVETSAATLQASRSGQLATASGTQYIRLFDLAGWTGAYVILSADYPDLGVIGWNDKASSYMGMNGLSFGLWTNVNFAGSGLLGCCNQNAGTLPSGYNNQISSVQQR
jgi:hypothetical protein